MPTSAIVIRRATSADAPTIKALTDAAYAKYVPMMGRLPQPMTHGYEHMVSEHDIWLLCLGDHPIAALVLMNKPDHLLIYNIAIHPDYQNAGWGRRLLAWAEAEAIRQGYTLLRLYTNALMPGNVDYYRRYGYLETSRENYLGSTLVHMEKRLPHSPSPEREKPRSGEGAGG